MISYTAGIRKIAEPPLSYCGVRDDFLRLAFQQGWKLAAWNGEVFLVKLEGISSTGLTVKDFAFGTDD